MLELCSQGRAQALATRLILREAERNLQEKLGEEALLRFYNLLAQAEPELIPLPSRKALQEAAELVAEKDAHVLAGAREGNATHLITLDRRHLLTNSVREGALPLVVCSPGEFLREFPESGSD